EPDVRGAVRMEERPLGDAHEPHDEPERDRQGQSHARIAIRYWRLGREAVALHVRCPLAQSAGAPGVSWWPDGGLLRASAGTAKVRIASSKTDTERCPAGERQL